MERAARERQQRMNDPADDPPAPQPQPANPNANVNQQDAQQPAVVAFARSPHSVTNNALDHTTTDGRKIHQAAVHKPNETLCDCDPDALQGFLEDLSNGAVEFGWLVPATGTLNMNTGTLANPVHASLIEECGTITIDQVRTQETIAIMANNRRSQDSFMLCNCPMNSLSNTGKGKVNIWKKEFTVNGIKSGPSSLRIIIRESHIDTNATESAIRTLLSNLDVHIVSGCAQRRSVQAPSVACSVRLSILHPIPGKKTQKTPFTSTPGGSLKQQQPHQQQHNTPNSLTLVVDALHSRHLEVLSPSLAVCIRRS